jgi:catechol 2,3-dioxygenase-like lactoylglutathione lyase family enzyme
MKPPGPTETVLRHVQHCNVNCRNLDRSVAFYRDELGLTPLVRTSPAPQDGTAFGIDGVAQWDAWMMSDGRANPVIDLLEWKIPTPLGAPHATSAAIGMIALRLATPAVADRREVTDPDGTRLILEPGEQIRLLGVTINVGDPDAAAQWYTTVLGLEATSAGLAVPGDDFEIQLRRGDVAQPAYTAAHNVGIFRMAFLVDDAAAAVAELRHRGEDCPDPVWLDMGPTIPIDGLWAVFFRDPDGTCLEFIESPNAN